MNWLWVIIVVAIIGGVISVIVSGKTENFLPGCLASGAGCGGIIFEILIAVGSLYLLFKLASWLFS